LHLIVPRKNPTQGRVESHEWDVLREEKHEAQGLTGFYLVAFESPLLHSQNRGASGGLRQSELGLNFTGSTPLKRTTSELANGIGRQVRKQKL
jgi:hypothetical protein